MPLSLSSVSSGMEMTLSVIFWFSSSLRSDRKLTSRTTRPWADLTPSTDSRLLTSEVEMAGIST